MVNNELFGLGKLAFGDPGTFAPLSGEAWLYALEMTLLGMGMIFAVLIVLWGVLAIFKLIFAKPVATPKAEEAPKVVQTQTAPTPEISIPEATSADDAELIAILTAAIVAYEAENGNEVSPSDFRVVSFRRTSGGRAWNSK